MAQLGSKKNPAVVHAKTQEITAGRNDTCPCGSGLKFKKCCLNPTKEKPLIKERDNKWWQIWK